MSLNTFLQRAINTLMTPAHQTIQQPTSSPHITSLRPQQPPAQPPSSTVNTFGFPSRGMVPHVRRHGRVSGTGLCGQVAVDVAPLGDTNQMEIAWGIYPKKTWKQPFSSRQLFDVTMLERFFAHAIHISNGLCIWENEEWAPGVCKVWNGMDLNPRKGSFFWEPRSRQFCVWFLCGKCFFCAGTSWFLVKIWYNIC